MNILHFFDPPTFEDPNPFPHVKNPKTGEAFTVDELQAIHKSLFLLIQTTAQQFLLNETGCEVPDFYPISLRAWEVANFCLIDSLIVANESAGPGNDPAGLEAF